MTRQGTEIRKHYIEFNTGLHWVEVVGTLDHVKKVTDECATYTQHDINILDSNMAIVAKRQWRNTVFDPELYEDGANTDIIDFGSYGYYDEWIDF